MLHHKVGDVETFEYLKDINPLKFHKEIAENFLINRCDMDSALQNTREIQSFVKYQNSIASITYNNLGMLPVCDQGHYCQLVYTRDNYADEVHFKCDSNHEFKEFRVVK
jgi:hypothetical protein